MALSKDEINWLKKEFQTDNIELIEKETIENKMKKLAYRSNLLYNRIISFLF